MTYDRADVSSNTSVPVRGDRTLSPRGTLVHTTSGVNSLEWLEAGSARAGRPASADALIDRTGKQYILTRPDWYAYHAGESKLYLDQEWSGDQVSQLLIGVELECRDTDRPTFQQYDSLADLITWYAHLWEWRWPFIIYGHYAVARPLGRRSDPVSFDWGTLFGRLFVRSWQRHLPGME